MCRPHALEYQLFNYCSYLESPGGWGGAGEVRGLQALFEPPEHHSRRAFRAAPVLLSSLGVTAGNQAGTPLLGPCMHTCAAFKVLHMACRSPLSPCLPQPRGAAADKYM